MYDWAKAVKEFDEAKSGVKGLVDAGVTELPPLFVHPPELLHSNIPAGGAGLELPTVDFEGLSGGGERRREVVEGIRKAAEEWGFFRIVNHGIPLEKMDAMLEAVRRFHELPAPEKMPLYSDDSRRKVRFNSNSAIRENDSASWRDILTCVFTDDHLDPDLIPFACRCISSHR